VRNCPWTPERRARYEETMSQRRSNNAVSEVETNRDVARVARTPKAKPRRSGPPDPKNIVGPVMKSMKILMFLRLGPSAPTPISRALGISKSSASRLLPTLELSGMVQRRYTRKGPIWELVPDPDGSVRPVQIDAPVNAPTVEASHVCRCTTVVKLVQYKPDHRRIVDGGTHVSRQLRAAGVTR
jgi:hypothetical protein